MAAIRFLYKGSDTTILSALCTACPHGPTGCCVVPPRMALADVARIVAHGGRDWLLGELAAGRITARGGWLVLTRKDACGYLGEAGCTIPHERRPATCNFYVCESALEAGGDGSARARSTRDGLEAMYAAWDAELATRASERSPGGIAFDGQTLDFLGDAFVALPGARVRSG
jgi:hypothetical protein